MRIEQIIQESDWKGVWGFLQEFATENYLAERKRHGLKGKISEDVWPFFLMMDDSCVMWENLLQGNMK